jgi:hypothetical protein
MNCLPECGPSCGELPKRPVAIESTIVVGDIELKPHTREVWKDGAPIEMTSFEFDILDVLMRMAGRVVSRDELAAVLYHREATPYERSHRRPHKPSEKKAGDRRWHADPNCSRSGIPVHYGREERKVRSVYIKALLLSVGILIFSMAGFLVISRTITFRIFAKGTPIGRNAATQFEEAGLEYENGGAKALSSYLGWQHSFYPQLHFYFARKGRDLVTGEDRSGLLKMAQSRWAFLTVTSP